MACRSPLAAFLVPAEPLAPGEVDRSRWVDGERVTLTVKEAESRRAYRESRPWRQGLPCGRCPECVVMRSADWSLRCELEAKLYLSSCMVTLTYAPEHLPEHGSLVREHPDTFLRRLRARLQERAKRGTAKYVSFRFFCVGEYGEARERPHYHVMLFGYFPHDAVDASGFFGQRRGFERAERTVPIYRSAMLESIWGKGLVSVSAVSDQTPGYVTRYTAAKLSGPASSFERFAPSLGAGGELVPSSERVGRLSSYGVRDPDYVEERDAPVFRAAVSLRDATLARVGAPRDAVHPTFVVLGRDGLPERFSVQWDAESAGADLGVPVVSLTAVRAPWRREPSSSSSVGWAWVARLPEFQTMSRRPGIGAEFVERFSSDLVGLGGLHRPGPPREDADGDVAVRMMPRYFERRLERVDPEGLARVISRRQDKGDASYERLRAAMHADREVSLLLNRQAVEEFRTLDPVERAKFDDAVAYADAVAPVRWLTGFVRERDAVAAFAAHRVAVRSHVAELTDRALNRKRGRAARGGDWS